VLVLDAFNGHAPPVHLLTDEAFEIYLQHLKPDGVIVVNITSHFVNLAPVIDAVAKKHGLGMTRVMTPYDSDKLLNSTDYMMLSRNQEFLAANPPELIKDSLQPDFEVPLWTDKYSNLFGVLKK
jgi:spermidine synthase